MRRVFFLVFFLTATLFAGTVRLTNDTAFKLRAVVRGSDGSYLGGMVVESQQTLAWNDYGSGVESYNQSRTPYIVTWYCMDGGNYSVCANVSTGATVTANSCDGPRYCKPPKKWENPPPEGAPTEDELQREEKEDAGPPKGYMQ